jgi:hypothetical protein
VPSETMVPLSQDHHEALVGAQRLPAYAPYGDVEHPAVTRTLTDHVPIRSAVASLGPGPDPALLHRLGAMLAFHVKLEERELFPLIEETMPPDALLRLGELLRRRA